MAPVFGVSTARLGHRDLQKLGVLGDWGRMHGAANDGKGAAAGTAQLGWNQAHSRFSIQLSALCPGRR